MRVLRDGEPPIYLIPGFILTLKKSTGILIEFIGAIDHAKLYCLNRSVEPPQLIQKRLTDIEKSDPPQQMEYLATDIEKRNVWIQNLVSKLEESLAEVEANSGKDRAAKTRERQETLRVAKEKAAAENPPSVATLSKNTRLVKSNSKKKRSREISSNEEDVDGDEPAPKKHKSDAPTPTHLHRHRSSRGASGQKKNNNSKEPSRLENYINFNGTKMSGVTFMLTPDLANSGATVTFTLPKTSGTPQ